MTWIEGYLGGAMKELDSLMIKEAHPGDMDRNAGSVWLARFEMMA